MPRAEKEIKQAVNERSAERWEFEFADIYPERGCGERYYRSECRPLRELKLLWKQVHTARSYRESFRTWLNERDRARKDLYWLGKECIGTTESGSGFVEHVHREMLAQFVVKNFDGVYHAGYTLEEVHRAIDRQEREKEMLTLCPTGSFKSTGNKIDSVQWLLNCPDIRVFIITGSGALSRKFLKEVKGFFSKPSDKPPTRFQALFPEYVIDQTQGETMAALWSPARIHSQPGVPSLWVNSIDGTIAGWHCDIWKADDIVNEDNSTNPDTCAILKDRYDNISENRPDKHAFKDQIGTRYLPFDWYGTRLEEARKFGETNSIKYLCRSAWTVRPGFEHVPIKQLQEHMVDLYFPEVMPFSLLIKKCRKNEKNFRCQQLNEPAGGDIICHFEREAIEKHTVLLSAVPRPAGLARLPAIVWDTAHGEKSSSDYSAGAVGWVDITTRALYVLEVAYGKWRDSVTAGEVVDLHWRWNAMFTEIEKYHGWELFGAEVQRISLQRYRKYVPLIWREASNLPKRNLVKGLETLLSTDRLFFVEGDWMEQTTQQFTRFTGASSKKKDDIPDAISKLQRLIPAMPALEENAAKETEEARKAREAQELREKFAAQQADSEYRTVFAVPETAPVPQPAAAQPAKQNRGPEWMFGNTGIHL